MKDIIIIGGGGINPDGKEAAVKYFLKYDTQFIEALRHYKQASELAEDNNDY